MTSAFTGMDFVGYASSPSASPSNTIFSNTLYFDSNSDSSSPNSPHVNQMSFDRSVPFEIYQYGGAPGNFYPAPGTKLPIDITSTTLDEKERRRKRSESSKTSDKESVSNMHLRRRAQNRASQRAFRERKEKHVKGLEHQLEELHEKHQDLLQSYSKQAEEMSRLNSQIADLSTELSTLRQCHDSSFSDMVIPDKFDKFDAFSSTDMFYSPGDPYYNRGSIDMNSEFAMHSFEDSL